MRTGIFFTVSGEDRSRLEAIISHPSSPQRHVWRCRIVLAQRRRCWHVFDHVGDGQVQDLRLALAGALHVRGGAGLLRENLLREKTRPSGTPRTAAAKVGEVIRLTQDPPPHEATHWTVRAMGKAAQAGRIHGAGDLEGTWIEPASLAPVQTVQRPGFRREIARCGWALRRTARPCSGAFGGRAVPNSGT